MPTGRRTSTSIPTSASARRPCRRLPPTGDLHRFADLVARIASLPLDRSRPLWELHVVQGLAHGHGGLITKMHHAAVDGIAGTEVMSVLLDDSPAGQTHPLTG
ncbi:MAG: wax ester/triacylglycerol synthase domain-containing protein [Mycobacterium sp.]